MRLGEAGRAVFVPVALDAFRVCSVRALPRLGGVAGGDTAETFPRDGFAVYRRGAR